MNFQDTLGLYIEQSDSNKIYEVLQGACKISVNSQGQPIPLQVEREHIITLKNCLIYVSADPKHSINLLKEIWRCLKNCVILNSNIQQMVVDDSVVKISKEICNQLLECDENIDECLKLLIVFLTNVVVNNAYCGQQIWSLFQDLIFQFVKDGICVHNNLALIYNILINNRQIILDQHCLETILNLVQTNFESEYLNFLFEYIVKHVETTKCYRELKCQHRIIILEQLKISIVNDNNTDYFQYFTSILIDDFKRKSDCILKTVTNYLKEIEPHEVSLLLDIISSLSSKDTYLSILQNDRSLFINCVFLLKSLHSAGKEGENNFTPVQKLSEMKYTNEEIVEHPAFGFKAALVRLLGNLCWKNRTNQDEVRKLECIPLLLDCCNIDARNPIIMQWAIFAVRNLCEQNIENQKIIASLSKQKYVNSAILNELGVTLHSDGNNEVKIAPLAFDK